MQCKYVTIRRIGCSASRGENVNMPINLAAKYGMQNLLTAIAPGLKRVRSS